MNKKRWISTKEFFKKDELVKHGSIMFVASIATGVLNYVYQIYMARSLGPEEYGIFGAMFAIFYMISVISSTISTSITGFVSKFVGEGKQIKFFVINSLKRFAIIGSIISIAVLVLNYIFDFEKIFKLTDSKPIYILILILFLTWITPIIDGSIRGMKKFQILGFSNIIGAFFKLFFGVLFVISGYGVSGALAGLLFGMIFALVVSSIRLKPHIRPNNPHDPEFNFSSLYSYSLPVMLTMIISSIPSNVDVIIAKYFFSPLDAGIYTSVSVLGKIILFLPGSIGIVMFPMIVQRHIKGENSLGLLKRGLIYTGLLSGFVSLIYLFFPGMVMDIFGEKYQFGTSVVGIYGLSMLFFSLIIMIGNYHLAIGNMRYTMLLTISMIVEIITIMMFHSSILEITTILMVSNFLILIASAIYTRKFDKNCV